MTFSTEKEDVIYTMVSIHMHKLNSMDSVH